VYFVIDQSGFRPNVGIILVNELDQLFWAKRIRQHAWQFPQGGVDNKEEIIEAMYRELWEEIGLQEKDVKILGQTKHWLRYKLPKKLLRADRPACVGQKQKWFLLRLVGDEEDIDFNKTGKPEFDDWQWVSYWYPIKPVVSFKKEVYRKALRELAPLLFGITFKGGRTRPLQNIMDG
jgi:putative (di)nucleoside polyphosphate hydrolase